MPITGDFSVTVINELIDSETSAHRYQVRDTKVQRNFRTREKRLLIGENDEFRRVSPLQTGSSARFTKELPRVESGLRR